MIRIAHEAPKSIFHVIQRITDYDYCLVHLLEEDPEYLNLFIQAKQDGREIILDNSVFELGTAFDPDKFNHWIETLKPSWYIIPDVLEDCEKTIENLLKWKSTYHNPDCKSIGVVQGKSYDEVVRCYKQIVNEVNQVAISFDYSFFTEWFPNERTKYHKWMKGRQVLLEKLVNDDVIDQSKPHHLLGCALPQEFKQYSKYKWIRSVDTSNPVVAGIKGIRYQKGCLNDKPTEKLFTLINEELNVKQVYDIIYNTCRFWENCNGNH